MDTKENPIEKLISDVSFPRKGDHFGVVCSYMADHSYRTDIFLCTASDVHRVVCKRLTNDCLKKPYIFHRSEWRFDDVSDLLDAAGISAEPPASEALSKGGE